MHSMDPETKPLLPEVLPVRAAGSAQSDTSTRPTEAHETHDLYWVLAGGQGLRAGWSLADFCFALPSLHALWEPWSSSFIPAIAKFDFSPIFALIGEVIPLLALLAAAVLMALIEHRRILDYNLTGPRRIPHFLSGMAAGFVALSALVGALAWAALAALRTGRALRRADLRLCRDVGRGLSDRRISMRRAPSAAICNSLSPAASTSGGRSASSPGLPAVGVDGQGQRCLGRLCRCVAGAVSLLDAAGKEGPTEWVLAGGLGHIDVLRLHPHQQQRRKLDWHLRRGVHRFCLLRQRAGDRLGLVGHRLPRRLGLGGDLLLRHCRQRHGRHRPLPDRQLPPAKPFWSGGTDGPEGSVLVLGVILLLLAALLLIYGRKKTEMLTAQSLQRAIG